MSTYFLLRLINSLGHWSLVPLISAVLSLKASELCHEVSLGEDLFPATALLPNCPHWLGQAPTRTAHARGRRGGGGQGTPIFFFIFLLVGSN